MKNEMSFANEVNTNDLFALPSELNERFYVMERLAAKQRDKTFLLAEKTDGKQYVLKCYKKEEIALDGGEADLLRGLRYVGLPTPEQDYDDGETLFVLREYVEGMPLDRLLEEELGEAAALHIALKLCGILAYLHKHNIIHRDVTPSNIIVNTLTGAVSLIDFGIARRYSKDTLKDTVSLGKDDFAPPEQHGYEQTDGRSDLYSLGVVLRLMLTGSVRNPVKNRSLSKIVHKCTTHDRGDRYQTAGALKRALLFYRWRARQKRLPMYAAVAIAIFTLALGFTAGAVIGNQARVRLIMPNVFNNPNAVYTFQEPLIEQAARLMLNKANDEPMTHGELANIRELHIWGDAICRDGMEFWEKGGEETNFGTITSLEDLRVFSRLASLSLSRQPFADLTPLTACKRLESIALVSCDVTDLSPLTEMTRLHHLNIDDCFVTDFSLVQNIRNLTVLDLHQGTNIKSIAELGDISHVVNLSLSSQLETLDGIETMTTLETLNLFGTNVRDFSPLNSLPCLKLLQINENREPYLDTLSNDAVEVILVP